MISRVNDLYNTISNVELEYPVITIEKEEVKLNTKNLNKYLTHDNQEIRREAFLTYLNNLKKINKSISGLFSMRYQICFDIACEKGYSSVLEQTLAEDDLRNEITTNLIKSVRKHLPLLERLFKLKKEKLKVEELHYYDLRKSSYYKEKIKFEEGLSLIRKAFKMMGPIYSEKLDEVLEKGSFDVFPKKNKISASYHFRNFTKPMILMNYQNNYQEVFDLAHELGHAVNGLLTREKQSYQNFYFSVFLSEVASLTNEFILEDYMLKNSQKEEEKIFLLESKLNRFMEKVFFATLYLEFQIAVCDKIEKNEKINADIINDTYFELFKIYFKGLTIDDNMKYYWQTRLHHFYDYYRYYNFQYATGLLSALQISNGILSGSEEKLNKYLEFLNVGGSMPTLDTLKIAGVDFLNISIYEESMKYFELLLDEYETLVRKK